MKNIAIFASGGGSNFRVIYSNIQKGIIQGEIVLVVSNNAKCGAIFFANEEKIENIIVNDTRFPNPKTRDKFLLHTLLNSKVELICLAGYMKLLPKMIIREYKNHILNIHPALLPQFGGKGFYGIKVHEAVLASGAEVSGVTVHLVDEEYDQGEIIAQEKIKVRLRDTSGSLSERILKIEHDLYSRVIKAFCNDGVIWNNNHPIIEA